MYLSGYPGVQSTKMLTRACIAQENLLTESTFRSERMCCGFKTPRYRAAGLAFEYENHTKNQMLWLHCLSNDVP